MLRAEDRADADAGRSRAIEDVLISHGNRRRIADDADRAAAHELPIEQDVTP